MVTARDLEILRSLGEFRLLTSKHLRDLHFADHASSGAAARACNRAVTRLHTLRLLRRIGRTAGGHGGGSTSFVWGLDAAGDRLLRHLTSDQGGPRFHPFDESHAFFEHTLAISAAMVELVRASRQGRFELLELTGEPRNWRSFPGELGGIRILKPDLFVTTARGDSEWLSFLEIDRGTESTPTLLKKCRLYETYRRTGTLQRHLGVFPRVVWALPSARRVELLQQALTHEGGVDPRLFTVITTDQLVDAVAPGAASPEAR
jgi:hypothetical protein